MRPLRQAVALVALSTIVGCAALLTGVEQKITVETRLDGVPFAGATCRLFNDKGAWFVTTPGSVLVRRAGGGLEVDCTTGGMDATTASLASTNNNAVFGNFLLGGMGGIAIDTGSGAAFHYPDRVVVDLHHQATAAEASTGEALTTPVTPLSPAVMATLKYQVAAERFARSLACAARPVAVPTSFATDGETYAIRCTGGDLMMTRCAADRCRVLR